MRLSNCWKAGAPWHGARCQAYAEALRAQREYAQALLVHDRIITLEPGNREGQRNRILAVARAGAPHRARELTQTSPGLLSAEEMLALRSDRTAVTTRWGAATDPDAPVRFAATDAALAQNAELLQQAQAAGHTASPALRRLQFDRIVLLRNRVRMQEAADGSVARPGAMDHGGAREARGGLQRARLAAPGRTVTVVDPSRRAARIAYADTLRELQDWEATRRETAALKAEYPEDSQVQRVARLWRIH